MPRKVQIKSRSGRSPLEVALEAARGAGDLLVENFGKDLGVYRKSRGNFLSQGDLLSEEKILGSLKEEFPGCSFISEESYPHLSEIRSEKSRRQTFTFVIDPLDGTNNYCFGLPYFCINIALMKGEETIMGLTYDPLRQEAFWATRGGGAYMNGERITVSERNVLQECLVGFDFGYSEGRGREVLDVVRALWPGVHSFRALGSSSLGLAYVACGRMNLYIHRFLFPWDIASGLLLVEKAGGVVTEWNREKASLRSSQIIAGNPLVHQQFTQWLGENSLVNLSGKTQR